MFKSLNFDTAKLKANKIVIGYYKFTNHKKEEKLQKNKS